jgi:hypothetical protein
MLHMFCNAFSSVFRLQLFQTHVSSVSSFFRRMLQMFHLDVLKVDSILHMLQWHRWLADNGLQQGFGSYRVPFSCGVPRPLLSSPSPPFPSLHFTATVRARRQTEGCIRPRVWAGSMGVTIGESSGQREIQAVAAHYTEQEQETERS